MKDKVGYDTVWTGFTITLVSCLGLPSPWCPVWVLDVCRYGHFDSGCPLFRDEDYLPTEEKNLEGYDGLDDLQDTIESLQSAMESKCPRCSKVGVAAAPTVSGAARWAWLMHRLLVVQQGRRVH